MIPSQTVANLDSATEAAWVGAVGTWAVGLVAGWIALMQYRKAKFRPAVWAFRDSVGRIMVRVINEGAGAGFVSDVNLMTPKHLVRGSREGLVFYRWELEGAASDQRPLPFSLAGGASAQLFLLPREDDKALAGVSLNSLRVRVDYGDGRDSGCRRMQQVAARIFGTTFIAGVTPARQ